ncbi:hypothetical protein [Streptomyces sp. SAS_260]|uniref:hypothetical protein n=1 Tax=Streptomyces sp. SAS_260 TaxID=3412751 RepID=UPI00403D0A1F
MIVDRCFRPDCVQRNPQMHPDVPAAAADLSGYSASAPQPTITPKRIIAEGAF